MSNRRVSLFLERSGNLDLLSNSTKIIASAPNPPSKELRLRHRKCYFFNQAITEMKRILKSQKNRAHHDNKQELFNSNNQLTNRLGEWKSNCHTEETDKTEKLEEYKSIDSL